MRSTRFGSFLLILTGVLCLPVLCAAQAESADNVPVSTWGKVVMGGDDRPVHDARVEFTLSSAEWRGTAYTDREGKFDFPQLSRGTYRVTVCATECETLEEAAQVDGKSGPVLLRLRQEGTPAVSRETFVVSVHELNISGKARKAFEKGTKLLTQGNTEESLGYFERAVAESPAYYQAHYNLGLAHARLGHTAEAEQALQKAIDLTEGRYALPQFGMGMLLCKEQQYRQAEKVIERGLELDPGSAVGKYFLGWAQFGLRRLVDAEKSLHQALFRNANQPAAYFLLAKIHDQQNNPYAVVKDLEDYLKLDSSGPGSVQARTLLEKAQRAMKENRDSVVVAKANP